MRKGMSVVLLVVVSATVLLMLAMIMMYMNQAPADWIRGFQASSEKCDMRGGVCIERSECEGQVVTGECGETVIRETDKDTELAELSDEIVCCFSPGGEE